MATGLRVEDRLSWAENLAHGRREGRPRLLFCWTLER